MKMNLGDIYLNLRTGEALVLAKDADGNAYLTDALEVVGELGGTIAPIDEVLAEIEAALKESKRSGRSYDD